MSHEEHGIAQTQIAAAKAAANEDGLQNYHTKTIVQQNERILVFVLALAAIALVLIWLTTSSLLLLAGSGLFTVVAIVLWGVARIRRIFFVREQREKDVQISKGKLFLS